MKIKPLHKKGSHLMIDAYRCKLDVLNNKNFIKRFLLELPKIINMHIILKPKVLEYEAPIPKESGITAFTIIAESHISIHTYPEKQFFSFDCYSCNEFDWEMAVNYIINLFRTEKAIVRLSPRGKDIHTDVTRKIITSRF